MDLFLNSITIRQAPTLQERVRIAIDSGFDGVELWMHEVAPATLSEADRQAARERYGVDPDSDEDGVALLRQFLPKTGVRVAGLCPATHAAENWHAPQCPDIHDSIRRTMEVCAALSGSYVILPMLAADADETETADNLALLDGYAGQFGVRLGFEPVGHIPSFASVDEALALLDRAGPLDHTGLILDLFHFFRAGQEPSDLAGLPADRVLMVHLNNAMHLPRTELLGHRHRVQIDEGQWDSHAFLTRFMRAGYGGDYAVEILNPEYLKMDAEMVASSAFETASAALERARNESMTA